MRDLRGVTRKHLRALAATVERGSVNGAAQSLNVTAPAVSVQLKLLEELVGSPLFQRESATPFAPTEIGAEILALARDVERLTERTAERIETLRAGGTGKLVFGVVSTGKYLAPSFVAAFGRENPGVRVKLSVGNREEIIRGLQKDDYDLVMMGRPPANLKLESATFGDHPHILIAPPGHFLENDMDILVEDLLSERFLAREQGSGTRILMDRFLDKFGGGRPFDVVEMGTNETIKQSVMAGLGLALISAHTCMTEIADGRLIALKVAGLPLVRQWFLLHRADRAPSAATLRFREFLLRRRESLFPPAVF
jgi:DNA-binding transcriptional LysR family regulator